MIIYSSMMIYYVQYRHTGTGRKKLGEWKKVCPLCPINQKKYFRANFPEFLFKIMYYYSICSPILREFLLLFL